MDRRDIPPQLAPDGRRGLRGRLRPRPPRLLQGPGPRPRRRRRDGLRRFRRAALPGRRRASRTGLIRAIGRIARSRAAAVVDAEGLAVSPGFIDVHDHTDIGLAGQSPRRERRPAGRDDAGQRPVRRVALPVDRREGRGDARIAEKKYGLAADWKDIPGFLAAIEKCGDRAQLHDVRRERHGPGRGHGERGPAGVGRRARPDEGARRRGHGRRGPGPVLGPRIHAEQLRLDRGAHRAQPGRGAVGRRLRHPHARRGDVAVLEAVDEALRIAREAPIRLQISHLKVGVSRPTGPSSTAHRACSRRPGPRALDLRCDRYPYIAGATGLRHLFPHLGPEGARRGVRRPAQGSRRSTPDLRPALAEELARAAGPGTRSSSRRSSRTRTAASRG